MPSRFIWQPNAGATGRYRDKVTGRFVSGKAVRDELDNFLDNSTDPTKTLADSLREGGASVRDWETGMRRLVKNTHLTAIAEERGGWANMTQADFGRAGQIIREQYGYLNDFAGEIASGEFVLDGRLEARSNLYVKAGRESFYKSKQAHAIANDLGFVKSKLNPADHCDECVKFNGVWYEIGDSAYKLPGQRQCLANCKCTEIYGTMVDGVIVEVGA